MELLGITLYVVSGVLLLVGYVWLLTLAFQRSTPFGIACFFVPIVLLYFLTMQLDKTWRPGVLLVGSLVAVICGVQVSK